MGGKAPQNWVSAKLNRSTKEHLTNSEAWRAVGARDVTRSSRRRPRTVTEVRKCVPRFHRTYVLFTAILRQVENGAWRGGTADTLPDVGKVCGGVAVLRMG